MSNGILPEAPDERRMRRRLYAQRALDRLGLLGEENLIPTLARRPALRWLADEGGARWDVLTELGRIGESGTFEEAVRWALENRPCTEEAKAYVWRLRSGTIGLPDVAKARRKPELSAINTRHETTRKGGEIMPYVYGLVGFVVTIVLAIIVLQFLL